MVDIRVAGAVISVAAAIGGIWVWQRSRKQDSPGRRLDLLQGRSAISPLHQALVREIEAATPRIQRLVRNTPLELSQGLSEKSPGSRVWIKMENEQVTGSFKVRGAVSRLAVLTDEEQRRGVVTASTGNHGAAVAFAASALSDPSQPLQCEIFLPRNVSQSKLNRLRRCGALTRLVDTTDCEVAETRARHVAEETHRVFVSPYNDMQVIAGQGTVGVEIGQEMDRLDHSVDAVLVPVGGGGLVSGVAAAIKAQFPACKVFGCQPQANACMAESVRAGQVLREEQFRNAPTWSDGTAGGVEEGALTFDACRTLVDQFLLVSEDVIVDAMALMMTEHHKIVEGAAGVAVGAFLANTALFAHQNVVIISCGSNLGPERILQVAQRAVQAEESE